MTGLARASYNEDPGCTPHPGIGHPSKICPTKTTPTTNTRKCIRQMCEDYSTKEARSTNKRNGQGYDGRSGVVGGVYQRQAG